MNSDPSPTSARHRALAALLLLCAAAAACGGGSQDRVARVAMTDPRPCDPQPAYSTGGTQASTDGGVTWGPCEGFSCVAGSQPTGGACSPPAFTLTLAAPAHGTVSGAVSGATFPSGTVVELTVTPEPRYGVMRWTGTGASCGRAARCAITMDADRTVGVHVGRPPAGFGGDVTGGEGGEVVTPTTGAELEAALCSSVASGRCVDATPRIVQLSSVLDFTNSEGKTTADGCGYAVGGCTLNGRTEHVLNVQSFCSGKPLYPITYDTAGKRGLLVGSNKTLVGLGTAAGLKGKGLRLAGGNSNIIIRNLSITDINEGIVWGGDGIELDDVSRVWIDHNYLARIGRMMIVSHLGPVTGVTISHNVLDGTTFCGHYCDGRHYWNLLLAAPGQTITLLGNALRNTSGDAPELGKPASAADGGAVHVVNNWYEGGFRYGVMGSDDVVSLVEGNAFGGGASFRPIYETSTNLVFAPLDDPLPLASANPTCRTVLGRACAGNRATSSTADFVMNPAVMPMIEGTPAWASGLGAVTPLDPALVPSAVQAIAGPQLDPDA